MARLRLFGPAREAAGLSAEEVADDTVGDVLREACRRHGRAFADVVGHSRIWVNGEPAVLEQRITDDDEVAILPPVSGG